MTVIYSSLKGQKDTNSHPTFRDFTKFKFFEIFFDARLVDHAQLGRSTTTTWNTGLASNPVYQVDAVYQVVVVTQHRNRTIAFQVAFFEIIDDCFKIPKLLFDFVTQLHVTNFRDFVGLSTVTQTFTKTTKNLCNFEQTEYNIVQLCIKPCNFVTNRIQHRLIIVTILHGGAFLSFISKLKFLLLTVYSQISN